MGLGTAVVNCGWEIGTEDSISVCFFFFFLRQDPGTQGFHTLLFPVIFISVENVDFLVKGYETYYSGSWQEADGTVKRVI